MPEYELTREEWNLATDKYIARETEKVGKPVVVDSSIPGSWPQAHSEITAEVIQDYSWNMGCNNPLFRDPEYAAKTRWGGLIAPPGRFVHYIAETASLGRVDVVPGHNHLYGGTIYEYFDVIRAGDRFTIKDEYLGIQEKKLPPEKAAKYRLLTMTAKRHYINQEGKTVVTSTGNTVITCVYPGDAKAKKDNVVYGNIKKPHYSKEELDRIHQHYVDYCSGKLTRGSEILYWEDVNEGDAITPLIKGPIDVIDVASFLCATGAQLGSGATKWELMRVALSSMATDPETGEYAARQNFHLVDNIAREMGFPMALEYAAMTEAYVSEAVTNWIGDDAFVKKLTHQHRKGVFHGETLYIKGSVSRKFVEDGKHFIEISVACENQNGANVCPSTALVQLVSRAE